mmetsp:Transcript_4631/g.8244  ORF Transcript_4631/g.8244 Transcript_4631/m.8244 type:complete len:95 (-) Transcript_4631:66-350(-)
MMQNMMNGMMNNMMGESESIRDQILKEGSKRFHLLSCLEWEAVDLGESNCLRFCMAQKDFDELKYHYVSLFHTDGWFRVGKPVQLLKAKPVFPL